MNQAKTKTFLFMALLAPIAACKGGDKEAAAPKAAEPAATAPALAVATATAPAPAPDPTPSPSPSPGPHDARFNLAIAIPKAVDSFQVPGINVVAGDAGATAAAFKQSLTDDNLGTFVAEDKLADGWAVRYKDDGGIVRSAVSRTLAGAPRLCTTQGDAQADHDSGRAICLGMRADGASVVVPFAAGADPISLSIGDAMISISAADADSPTSADAATSNAKNGLKVLRSDPVAGGFAVAYQTFNGGIEAQGLIYRAAMRAKIGGVDLVCSDFAGAKSADAAVKTLDACRGLRAP